MASNDRRSNEHYDRGEVLVAILPNKRDLSILKEQGWYRIPVAKAPRRWPPKWLAFYQPKVFGAEAYAVNYYGRVREIRIVRRRELFPDDPPSRKSNVEYYRVSIDQLIPLDQPIPSLRLRRIVFIPTTLQKLLAATEINDLFDESPLEDRLWAELKRLGITAERQMDSQIGSEYYMLDFALYCQNGRIDIETDGDTWHADPARIPEDNKRNNALEAKGWHVLRFNGQQIRESMAEYCVPKITETINRLGGLSDEGLAPRTFYQTPEGIVQQLTIFDERPEYRTDEAP